MNPHEHITIIGAGQMGLVLADALHETGAQVTLWGPFRESIEALARTRQAPKRLPGFVLSQEVEVTTDLDGIDTTDMIVNAIPTQHIRSVWERLGDRVRPGASVVCVAKGIENGTLLRPTEVIAAVLAACDSRHESAEDVMCALSGPTIAAELAQRLPATMVAAAIDDTLAQRVQQRFSAPWLRIYHSVDLVGVELAGAAKNVIALAAGMIDGLGVGDNAKSALLARGLAEICRLGEAMGALRDTFFGVAGLGDLATTCFSPSGRNRTCGQRLGEGETLEHILETTVHVIEGVATARSLIAFADRVNVEMPISGAVHAILFEQLDPAQAIEQLMRREPKAEFAP